MRKFLLSTAIAILMVFCSAGAFAASQNLLPVNDLNTDYENAIVNTFKQVQVKENGFSLNYSTLKSVGSTYCDWLAMSCGRYGYPDNTDEYLSLLADYVTKTYASKGNLGNNPTEYCRIILAIKALGGNPESFGKNTDGSDINLLADGIYNKKMTKDDGKLSVSINAAIWALITLNSYPYEVPEDSLNTKESLVKLIADNQVDADGGGFALTGAVADPDLSAMAIAALAPYYDTNEDAKKAVDNSLALISESQQDDGTFKNPVGITAETNCQIIVALCSLGIDLRKDERFIKKGNTALDGLMTFYNPEDGGYYHLTSNKFKTDPMATFQARYAMVAFYRFVEGFNPLYDYTEEADRPQNELDAIIGEIEALTASPTLTDVDTYFTTAHKYNMLNTGDKEKITNAAKLTAGLGSIKQQQAAINVEPDNGGSSGGNSGGNSGGSSGGNSGGSSGGSSGGNSGGSSGGNSGGSSGINSNSGGNSGSSGSSNSGASNRSSASKSSSGKSSGSSGTTAKANTGTTANSGKSAGASGAAATTTTISNTIRMDASQLTNGIVPKSNFEAIQGQAKNLVISGSTTGGATYTITFHGADITEPMDFDMRISETTDNRNAIEALAEDPYIISFMNQGDFPGEALITMNSLPVEDGDNLLFLYDSLQVAGEFLEKVSITGGSTKFILSQGGDYFLSTRVKSGSLLAGSAQDGAAPLTQTGGFHVPVYLWYTLGGLFLALALAFAILWWRWPRFRLEVKYILGVINKNLKIFRRLVMSKLKVFGRWSKYHLKIIGSYISRGYKGFKRGVSPLFKGIERGLKGGGRGLGASLKKSRRSAIYRRHHRSWSNAN